MIHYLQWPKLSEITESQTKTYVMHVLVLLNVMLVKTKGYVDWSNCLLKTEVIWGFILSFLKFNQYSPSAVMCARHHNRYWGYSHTPWTFTSPRYCMFREKSNATCKQCSEGEKAQVPVRQMWVYNLTLKFLCDLDELLNHSEPPFPNL